MQARTKSGQRLVLNRCWARPRAAAVLVIATALGGCRTGVLDPHGPIGKAEGMILLDATVIMLAVVIPVIVLTLAFAWWFRASNARAKYLPDWEFSGRIEMVVWSIPTLVILFLGGIAWTASHDLDPAAPLAESIAPLDIEVISLDWRWLFIYPQQGIASLNQLVIPTGVPLRFRLTSNSVMNSFFVPQLGSQIYTMPGMVTRLNLQADDPGMYQGLSAQFSGEEFSDMRFDVMALRHSDFEAWVGRTKTLNGELNADIFRSLAKPAKADSTQTFASVSAGLFDSISTGHAMSHNTAATAQPRSE